MFKNINWGNVIVDIIKVLLGALAGIGAVNV